jgi:hypothetical protein
MLAWMLDRLRPHVDDLLARLDSHQGSEPSPAHRERIERAIDEKLRLPFGIKGAGGRVDRVLSRGLYKHLPRLLREDEEVIAVGDGWFAEGFWGPEGKRSGEDLFPKSGYVALTDRRILLIATAVWGLGSRGVETIPLNSVVSVDGTRWIGQSVTTPLVGVPLRLNTGGGEIRIRVSPAAVADVIVNYVRERLDEPQPPSTASASDPASTLAKLAELHKAGVVTDDEFASKKAELLSRI